jgi:thioredoxin reductase (NADPH)
MNTPNIQIHWNTETEEILGDESGVTGVRIY